MTHPQSSLYSNSDKDTLGSLYPDIGFISAIDLYAPREIRNPDPTKEEKEKLIAQSALLSVQN